MNWPTLNWRVKKRMDTSRTPEYTVGGIAMPIAGKSVTFSFALYGWSTVETRSVGREEGHDREKRRPKKGMERPKGTEALPVSSDEADGELWFRSNVLLMLCANSSSSVAAGTPSP